MGSGLYKKLHRWPGLIISFLLLYFAITGIIMNHRGFFSGIDVKRKYLPGAYTYNNWNNAAIKGSLALSPDSVLVYGNIGIWLTDSTFTKYLAFNPGFPKGSDNCKIFDVHQCSNGSIYAATHFGLYAWDHKGRQWLKCKSLPGKERFTGIESINDTLYALSRSHLYKGKAEGTGTRFEKIEIPPPLGYQNNVSLFKTIWQIHSGEIFGMPGKVFVDIMGLVTLFLSITGIIFFFFPGWIKRRFWKQKPIQRISSINKWSLKWHNYIGAWTFIPLAILFFTGIFLRPPLLIAIARAHVAPLKFSHLDQPNPWHDKLRDILYDPHRGILLLSTSEGMYFMDKAGLQPTPLPYQPPVSVMGINVFEPIGQGAFLIGSFSGIFLWHPEYPEPYHAFTGKPYYGVQGGRPVGDYKITGVVNSPNGKKYIADYDKGMLPLWHDNALPPMPETILENTPMSLWNLSLEIHTGRFFQGIMGGFYILIVPLSGLIAVIVVISGYLLYKKKYVKSRKKVVTCI